MENFLKDHFLPAMFVDYRKCVQQAISSKYYFKILKYASGYSILKQCANITLMNYKANCLCMLCASVTDVDQSTTLTDMTDYGFELSNIWMLMIGHVGLGHLY